MIEYTVSDVIIASFILFHASNCYFKGIRRALFDILKVFGTAFATFLMYKILFSFVSEAPIFMKISKFMHGFSANLFKDAPILEVLPWDNINFCLVTYVLIFFVLKILIIGFEGETPNLYERVLGMMFGIIKAVIYLSIILSFIYPSAYKQINSSKSILLPYLIKYNFLISK